MSNAIRKRLGMTAKLRGENTRKTCRFLRYKGKQKILNEVTLAAMDNALAGFDVHGPFDSVEALMADLNA